MADRLNPVTQENVKAKSIKSLTLEDSCVCSCDSSLYLLLAGIIPASAQVTAAISGPGGGRSQAARWLAQTITVTSLETRVDPRHPKTDKYPGKLLRSSRCRSAQQEVKVEKQGFQPIDRTGIHLRVGQNARVKFPK